MIVVNVGNDDTVAAAVVRPLAVVFEIDTLYVVVQTGTLYIVVRTDIAQVAQVQVTEVVNDS